MGSGTPPPEEESSEPSVIRRIITTLRQAFGGGDPYPGTATPEFTSFEEAERAAFKASMTAPSVRATTAQTIAPDVPADPAQPPGWQAETVRRARSSGAKRPEAIRATVARLDGIRPAASPAEAIPSSTVADAPGVRSRRRPGDTAPESLLRAPAGAAAVADDFFDALVRRVEGDR